MNDQIPASLNEKILKDIKSRLNPDLKMIFLKLFAVHLITALITLAICPQFGFQTFKSHINLMELFMKLGNHFCNFACGVFFTATSVFIALFIISRDELRVLRHHRFTAVLLLVLVSIGFFAIMNSQLFFELSLLWILGASSGTLLTLEIGTKWQLTSRI